MRSPLAKLEITTPGGVRQDFKAHTGRAYPGIDLVTYPNYVQPVYAIEDGYAIAAHDGVDPYMQLNGKTGSWIYAHLSQTTPTRQVKEGEIIGYTGRDHLHLGLIQNGNYVDPEPYLKQFLINPTNSTVNNQNMQVIANTNQYPSLSLIARDVYKWSDWNTQTAWLRVLDINPHLRTGDLDIIPNNQPIYAQSITSQVTENNQELKNLKAELEAKKRELDNTAKDFQTKLAELENKQKEEVSKIVAQYEESIAVKQSETDKLQGEMQKLTKELLQLKQEAKIAFNLDFEPEVFLYNLAQDAVKAEGSNILEKIWNSKTRKSLTKYDWKYILFSLIPLLMLFPEKIEIAFGIAGFATTAKIILDRVGDYLRITGDRTGDGKLTIEDTDALKNYRASAPA